MKTMSLNKIGGLCLCVGAAFLTIPFFLQITFGGTPEEGFLIWRYFANEITSAFAGLHVVNHIYTIFNLDPMSASSIMPFFIGMSLGQLVLLAFNVSLGMKMMKE